MPRSLALETLTPEQRELWNRVSGLWEQSRGGDRALIGAGIHPQYVGWDMSTELPHDKSAAVASVTDDAPKLMDYVLFPHSIQSYDHLVGVVHYSYRATVQPHGASPLDVTGRWTEVYLRQHNEWVMVAVSGRPDPSSRPQPPLNHARANRPPLYLEPVDRGDPCMSTVSSLSGTCLCGKVRIEILERPDHAPEACHCKQCRKQSGHFLAAVNVKRDTLRVHGYDKVTWYASSDQVERGFCSTCGSTLFWKPVIDGYQYTAVAMGALETPTGMKLSKHTFVGDKGDYYEIADGVPQSDSY